MGYALHYNIDPTGAVAVPGTSSDPNPEFWELTYKDGKGFILIEGSEEIASRGLGCGGENNLLSCRGAHTCNRVELRYM